MTKRPKAIKPGRVRKIIKPIHPSVPEKAEIDGDHLYREIRIDNVLEDEHGYKVKLKEHADVDVVIEAEPKATEPKQG
jgi:hypothetical protein